MHLSSRAGPWLAVLASLAPVAAHATTIVGTPTGITIISPPASFANGASATTSNSTIYAIQEQQNVVLTSALKVDINSPGTYSVNTESLPSPAPKLAEGTDVDSFFLQSDPGTFAKGTDHQNYTGTITFGEQILGIEVLSGKLNNTDSLLGLSNSTPPTTYDTDSSRGLELNSQTQDLISWTGNTVTLNLNTYGSVDDVRIITAAAAPEPSSIAPFAFAALGLAGLMLRARKQNQAA